MRHNFFVQGGIEMEAKCCPQYHAAQADYSCCYTICLVILREGGKGKNLPHGYYGQLESHVQEIGDRREDSNCS